MQIDGKKINSQIGEKLLKEIQDNHLAPSLGILCVGDDPASLSFIAVKKKFGEKYGFKVSLVELDEQTRVETIKETLVSMQTANHAVILQLPLPEKFKSNTEEILQVIEKQKDVDDLNAGNFQSPIVLSLEKVLSEIENSELTKIDFKNASFAIVGLGQVVGTPLKKYLDDLNYQVEVIKKGEYEKLKNSDVVISGVGVPFLIKGEYIKLGAVLVDYGCSFVPDPRGSGFVACGDFDPDCYEKSGFYTPVPGCMGPLVVACLFENVLKSAKI